jgi:hypothetical protein
MPLTETSSGAEQEGTNFLPDTFGPITESVIKPVVRRKLHVTLSSADTRPENQDAMELVAEIQLVLLAELKRRSCQNGEAIKDLPGFASAVASNACYQYLRSRFPVRTRQKNKIRYILSHDASFAVWKDADGCWLSGYSEWKESPEQVRKRVPAEAEESIHIERGGSDRELYVSLMTALFDQAGGPVPLDDLVQFVMKIRGLREVVEVADVTEELGQSVHRDAFRDPRPLADSMLESVGRLKSLWQEIVKLPPRHRKALLLNLKDPSGDSLIAVLPLSGTAALPDIASALEMSAEELASIWNSLPWDDLRIAGHLGLTRQQVINLRQSARARLARLYI